MTHLRNLLS